MTQLYIIFQWGGDDLLLRLNLDENEYQNAQVNFTQTGDGGWCTVGLCWLIAANCVLSPFLFCWDQNYSPAHVLLDLMMENMYGVWWLVASSAEAKVLLEMSTLRGIFWCRRADAVGSMGATTRRSERVDTAE